jgi:aldehyde dehydrogenase (NAD+)
MKHYGKFYIDGQWVEPLTSRRTFDLVNPASEAVFATVALGGADDVDRAVSAARTAFPAFSAMTKADRIALLQRIVLVLEDRQTEMMRSATEQMGAPRSALGVVRTAIDAFRQAVVTLTNYAFETRMGPHIIRRESVGVCGLITAWNHPVQILCTKLSSALAAGCTVVAKPSEFTPISAIQLAEVLHTAGVPNGVFNLVNGDGLTVGNAISSHPDIDMVSFTGSTRAGVMIAQAAAPTVKRVCQELGGKSANIILPDADLAAAARWNISRGCANTGQSCHSPTRILVHESQREEMLDLLAAEMKKVVVGDPLDEATAMGPVVNKAQFDRVQGYIEKGIEEGARLVCGGPGRPQGLERGYFVQPTLLADVTPSMTIAREEIFGPVLAVMTYRTEDEAVEIANGTVYGLGGYLFTSDPEKGHAVAARMRAGRIFFNGAPSSPDAPMGGYKQSGNGREMGVFGLEEYLEVKAMFGFPAATTA